MGRENTVFHLRIDHFVGIAWAAQYTAAKQASAKALQLEQDVAKLEPIAEAYGDLTDDEGVYTFNDAAKQLGIRPHSMKPLLDAIGANAARSSEGSLQLR